MTALSAHRDPLVIKVRKLLAKAEATDNVNEAEAFSAKAAALIAEHRLDPDRLAVARAVRPGAPPPPRRSRRLRPGTPRVLQAVVDAHDAAMVWEPGPDGAVAVLAGFAADLDVVAVLYDSLHTQAAGQMARIVRPTGAATQRWRRSFLFGFAARVTESLADVRRRAEETAGASGRAGLPQRLTRADQVDAFARLAFGRVVAAQGPRPAQRAGWDEGSRAAARADLGRRRISEPRALGSGAS